MMGLNPGSSHQMTRPLTRARRTVDQSIKTIDLISIDIIYVLIDILGGYVMHLKVAEVKVETSRCRNRDNLSAGISTVAFLLSMPRARGWPHRGMAWYVSDSRRKRQQKFERDLTVASRRRTRKSRRIGMPPMLYVEEITPDESIQNYSKNLLFTIPDNSAPPSCFRKDAITPTPRPTHGPRDTPAAEFTFCIMEEEIQEGTEGNIHFTTDEPPKEMV
jgi:hypothetical protein